MKLFLTKRSLIFRLCLLITIGMLIIVLSFAFALYCVLHHDLKKLAENFLQNETSIITDILKKHANDYSALDQEIIWEPQSQNYNYLATITNAQGTAIKTTPTFDVLLPYLHITDYLQKNKLPKIKKIKIHHKIYAVTIAQIKTHNRNEPFLYATIAYNISHNESILQNFTESLILITILGLLLIIISSFVLIKAGLSPLTLLVRHIENMNIHDLDQRLDEQKSSVEIKPLVQAFNHLLDEIAENIKKIADFSANVAHELRTPINNLIIETEILLTQDLTPKKAKELLTSNLEEYQRLGNIIEKLLFLAKSDANKLILNRTELYVTKEIQILLDFYDAMLAEKNIHISIEGNAVVKADRTLLRHAIANLLENAIKYSTENSKITIEITTDLNSVTVAIIDEGLGITAKHLSHLTERFYRIEGHRNSSTGGAGLGLAIVDSIMKAHGGTLAFQTNFPSGLIAQLHFPKN